MTKPQLLSQILSRNSATGATQQECLRQIESGVAVVSVHAADEYAEKMAVDFGRWLVKNTLSFGKHPNGGVIYIMENGDLKTSAELYKDFLKSQEESK